MTRIQMLLSLIFMIILFGVVLFILMNIRDPPVFTEVKQKYAALRQYIATHDVPEKFKVLTRQIVLIGYIKKKNEIGYNTNKGYEIGLCLDGDPNDVFHVLLHELAHSTVDEYSHSEQFWKNFAELRDICANMGLYQRIPDRKEFCGQYIND
jgi:hypothetical protein